MSIFHSLFFVLFVIVSAIINACQFGLYILIISYGWNRQEICKITDEEDQEA